MKKYLMIADHLKRRSRGYYLFHEPVMRYWLLAMVLLAVYLPTNILDQAPLLRDFINLISAVFPPIANYAAHSSFPQVTKLYMSLAWITAPLHAYYLWKEYETDAADWVLRFKAEASWPLREKIKGIASLLILPPLLYFGSFHAMGHDFNLVPFNSSRYALGLFGWMVTGSGIVVLVTFWCLQARQMYKLEHKLFK